jgi:hypothetical protein
VTQPGRLAAAPDFIHHLECFQAKARPFRMQNMPRMLASRERIRFAGGYPESCDDRL